MEGILNNILYRLQAMENHFRSETEQTQNHRTYADVVKYNTTDNYYIRQQHQQQHDRQTSLPTPQQRQPLLPTPQRQPLQPTLPQQQERKQPLLPTPSLLPAPPKQLRQPWTTTTTRQQHHTKQQQPQQHTMQRRQHQQHSRPRLQQHQQHPPLEQRQQQQQMYNKPLIHQTEDPSFAKLLKMLYRGTQLRRHANNWKNLPGSVERRIDLLFDFLTPPIPTEELKTQLDSMKSSIKHEIKTVILTHINIQTDSNHNMLKQITLHEADKDAARVLAERVIRREYGRKTSSKLLNEWLTADLSVVGQLHQTSSSTPPTTSSTIPTTTPTSPTSDHTSTSTSDQTTTTTATSTSSSSNQTSIAPNVSDIIEEAPDRPQAGRKRRRISAYIEIPVSNRFNILTEEPTETDEQVHSADTIQVSPTEIIDNNRNRTTINNILNETVTDTDLDDAETWSMTSTQCDQLLSSQPPISPNLSSNPPNQSCIQKKKQNIFIYESTFKTKWVFQVKHLPKTVLLTDSNFRLAQHIPIPDDWEIHVYPGCAFSHVARMLRLANIPSCVENIVLAVGINHRNWKFDASVKPDWNKMLVQTRSLEPAVHFLGVSAVSPDETLKTINEEGRKHFGKKFIPALPENQVTISPTDHFKIHHDKATVEKIINSIKIHLN